MSVNNVDDARSQDVKHLKNQLNVARNEINNLRQQLKTLIHAHRKDCQEIKDKLEGWRCLECRSRQPEQGDNGSHADNENPIDLSLQYIGLIHTQFPEKRGTPRQPPICSDVISKLTLNNSIFTNPSHALDGLQEYSHIWILFHFHCNDSTHVRAKVAPPRMNGLRTGVFATRSPHRPCPIGLSLVKIDRIVDDTIYFGGVDMVDQTPVLDIKPYIPQYDNPLLMPPASLEENTTDVSASSNLHDSNMSATDSMFNVSSLNDVSEVDIASGYDNMNNRIMDGEENGGRNQNVPSVRRNSLTSNLEELFYSRSASRMGEREAPDGEEEETPRQPIGMVNPAPIVNTPEGHIRVPTWIDQSSGSMLTVLFKERAVMQLNQLGSESEEKRSIITNVLREDPRSVYLRERLGSHCYIFRIADLNVSCKFNDAAHAVTVFKIFQNSISDSDE